MIKIYDKEKCSGCCTCEQVCPKKCISMESDEEGFLYPSIKESLCIDCGLCEKSCPIQTPIMNDKREKTPCSEARCLMKGGVSWICFLL